MYRLLCTTAPMALLCAGSVLAQEGYLGLGLGGASIRPSDYGEYTEISVIGGYRFAVGGNFFVGGEVETGTANGSDDIDGLSRARLVAGIAGDQLTFFGAIGAVRMRGDFADLTGENSGVTFGLGVEMPVQDRFKLRLEAIRDSYDTGSTFTDGKITTTTPDWDVTTLRVGAFFRF